MGATLAHSWPSPPRARAELYQALLQSVVAVLTWQRPLVTLPCLAVVLALTWFPRYIYSALQFLLAVYILYAYVCRRGRAQALELQQATGRRYGRQ